MSDEKQKRGLAKTLDAGEKQYFGNTTDNSGTVTQFLTLNGSDGNTYFLNTNNGKIYTEEFVNEGYKTKVSATNPFSMVFQLSAPNFLANASMSIQPTLCFVSLYSLPGLPRPTIIFILNTSHH